MFLLFLLLPLEFLFGPLSASKCLLFVINNYYICINTECARMTKLYFEEKGAKLLADLGISKAEFARRMDIHRQNVNSLFRTKNLATIFKASQVLKVPFELLIGYTSEPDFIPENYPVLETLEPIGFSPFGAVYDSFRGKPRDAFWFLIDHQNGDLRGVFHRKEIGDIDLVWGDKHSGICHILLKHINHKDYPTVSEMIDGLSELITQGKADSLTTDKLVLRKDGYMGIIRRNYRIKGKKPESKNWVLTAYNKESSDTTQAPPGTD